VRIMKINALSTLHSRITIAFLSLIGIIIVCELVAYYRIKRLPNIIVINTIRQSITKLQKEEVSLKEHAIEFILREKNNQEFFKTGQSQFLKKYQKSFDLIHEDLRSVQKQTLESGLDEATEITSFKKALSEYDTIFRTMVVKIKERGYDKFGIIGEFDNAIMDLVRHDFGVDNIAILNLQLYVKEYLLSGNKGATNNVSNEIYNFSTVIEKYVKDDQVESVINSLSTYESSFKKLVTADEELGTYSGQGLAKDLLLVTALMDTAVQLPDTQTQLNQTFSSVSSQIYFSIILVTCMAIFISIVISSWLNRTIVKPFHEIKKVISSLGLGEIPQSLQPIKLRDLNEIVIALNSLISNINEHHEFAATIGKGNFTASFKKMSDKDALGKALLNMRDSLYQFDLENRQRTWVAQGIAQFADIFRKTDDRLQLAINQIIISNIAEYLGVHLAGLYLINHDTEDDVFIELAAAYGFEQEKISTKRIEIGQGLLGQAIAAKESTYLLPVPKDYYVRITSGLGQSRPVALLITPLKHNEIVIGAIEVASLAPIPEYQRLFVEKVAETVASNFSSMKTVSPAKRFFIEPDKKQRTLEKGGLH